MNRSLKNVTIAILAVTVTTGFALGEPPGLKTLAIGAGA